MFLKGFLTSIFILTILKICKSSESINLNEPLILTPYIERNETDLAKNYSLVDHEYFLKIKSYSGFLTVNKKYNSNLFFWFFPALNEKQLNTTPWIIWLDGGPGYSSMQGLFGNIGPLKVEDGQVTARQVTWASDYSVLFVDNPVGAGFSFTDHDDGYPNNEEDIGAQMYVFLQQFLELFPQLRSSPLFISGQSYAGKYVPALAIQIHRHSGQDKPIKLKGISIGNGLIDPKPMMKYSQLCKELGILEGADLVKLKELEDSVVGFINKGEIVNASNAFNATIKHIAHRSGVSVYNYNQKPSPKNQAPGFEHFLNRPDVRARIHAGAGRFHLNNQLVYAKMLPDIMASVKGYVEELLEHYGVLVYNGQLDIILPYSLAKNVYDGFHWSRQGEFRNATRRQLIDGQNKLIGYIKHGDNLVEALIRLAGHAVPTDQPEAAKYLIDLFIDAFKSDKEYIIIEYV
ncbi:hypothetical protein JYU34_002266 [Plutella xylostella]|uniref:Carboxypeptidase n=1 Tax=Plutella xylostella TaxID=51655 RepID=A0ABQ7R1V3_PLUXY|nr:hypothetical protein JYU34_002266 [Plutella xylostella]